MTDKNVESAPAEGIAGSPNSDNSAGASGQQTSHSADQDLLKQVETLIDRKLQSSKDRRFAKIEETINNFAPVLERFKGLVDDDKLAQIQRDLEFEDLKKRVYGDRPSEPQDGTQGGTAPDLVKVVDDVFGLPENDSRVTDIKLKYANDPAGYLKASLELAAKLSEQRESTPAEQPITQGGVYRQPENPIAEIDDPKTLYRLAAQQIAKQATSRRRGSS